MWRNSKYLNYLSNGDNESYNNENDNLDKMSIVITY